MALAWKVQALACRAAGVHLSSHCLIQLTSLLLLRALGALLQAQLEPARGICSWPRQVLDLCRQSPMQDRQNAQRTSKVRLMSTKERGQLMSTCCDRCRQMSWQLSVRPALVCGTLQQLAVRAQQATRLTTALSPQQGSQLYCYKMTQIVLRHAKARRTSFLMLPPLPHLPKRQRALAAARQMAVLHPLAKQQKQWDGRAALLRMRLIAV